MTPMTRNSAAIRFSTSCMASGKTSRHLFSTGGWSLIEDLRRQHKINDFLVVAPEKAEASTSTRRIIRSATAISFFRNSCHTSRAGTGCARDGQNTSHHRRLNGRLRSAAFRLRPPELFSGVSAQSAALITQTPQELNAAGESNRSLGRLLRPAFGQPINATHWNKTASSGWRKAAPQICGNSPSISTADSRTTSGSKTAQRPCTGNWTRKA